MTLKNRDSKGVEQYFIISKMAEYASIFFFV